MAIWKGRFVGDRYVIEVWKNAILMGWLIICSLSEKLVAPNSHDGRWNWRTLESRRFNPRVTRTPVCHCKSLIKSRSQVDDDQDQDRPIRSAERTLYVSCIRSVW